MRTSLYWILKFLTYTFLIILAGGLIGLFAFLITGFIFETHYSFAFLIKKGFSVGARYASVWAIGLSIVLCFIKAHKKNKRLGTHPS